MPVTVTTPKKTVTLSDFLLTAMNGCTRGKNELIAAAVSIPGISAADTTDELAEMVRNGDVVVDNEFGPTYFPSAKMHGICMAISRLEKAFIKSIAQKYGREITFVSVSQFDEAFGQMDLKLTTLQNEAHGELFQEAVQVVAERTRVRMTAFRYLLGS